MFEEYAKLWGFFGRESTHAPIFQERALEVELYAKINSIDVICDIKYYSRKVMSTLNDL